MSSDTGEWPAITSEPVRLWRAWEGPCPYQSVNTWKTHQCISSAGRFLPGKGRQNQTTLSPCCCGPPPRALVPPGVRSAAPWPQLPTEHFAHQTGGFGIRTLSNKAGLSPTMSCPSQGRCEAPKHSPAHGAPHAGPQGSWGGRGGGGPLPHAAQGSDPHARVRTCSGCCLCFSFLNVNGFPALCLRLHSLPSKRGN